jgi:hypothetical protein
LKPAPQSQKVKKVPASHALVGRWVNGDEEATDVEYIVSASGKRFNVRAIDRFDGEEAEIAQIFWDGRVLSFGVHWVSTGRFVKCRFLSLSKNRIDFTYTYSAQEMWHRKGS